MSRFSDMMEKASRVDRSVYENTREFIASVNSQISQPPQKTVTQADAMRKIKQFDAELLSTVTSMISKSRSKI